MRLKELILGLSTALLVLAGTQSLFAADIVDGPIAGVHLMWTVQNMLHNSKFAGLEEMAHEFRKSKARFSDGTQKLKSCGINIQNTIL